MIQLKFRQFQTDSEDDSAMIQKGIFHEGYTYYHVSYIADLGDLFCYFIIRILV